MPPRLSHAVPAPPPPSSANGVKIPPLDLPSTPLLFVFVFVSLVQDYEDDYGGFMVQVMSGGSVEFTGEMTGTGLNNMRSVFYNNAGGSIE